ncbi:unnamed protein product [Clonostachys chloroleuca]|uniref:Uncharacterized protein n=1 Tax=Clonostachys chloroleuca TaxID=1926264 RepID=A0AA35M1N3_9HYPO|nr:unnamed protein product [Clonostachys chloroleuca]
MQVRARRDPAASRSMVVAGMRWIKVEPIASITNNGDVLLDRVAAPEAPMDQSEFGLGCRKDDSLSMYLLSRCQQLPSGIGFFGTWPLPSFRMIQLPVAVDSAIKAVLSID